MLRMVLLLLVSAGVIRASVTNPPRLDMIVVAGAPGAKTFESDFAKAAEGWMEAARKGEKAARLIGGEAGTNQLEVLRRALAEQVQPGDSELWLVFIGHGTFDGKTAKFNLHGPDISAEELAEIAGGIKRTFVLVNTTSSSAPFLNKLSGPNRVVVTATKSGWEENYARFGNYMAETIADPAADLDKDGQTSLLEAFLMASRKVADFYEGEGRLATEHALIDDNGDGLGTPATFFRGVRAEKKAAGGAEVDGLRAHQIHLVPSPEEARLPAALRAERNRLELELEEVRGRRAEMTEEEYLEELERVLVAISRIYQQAEESGAEAAGDEAPK